MHDDMYKRQLQQKLLETIDRGKAVILIGARQVGKTTLLKQLVSDMDASSVLWLNCDMQETRSLLSTTNLQNLKMLIGNAKLVVIDEAQRVPEIGMTLKIIVDNMPDVRLLVTGSSAFELRNRLNESLTGRKQTQYLYPISTAELYDSEGMIATRELLPQRLIYGSYPAIMLSDKPADELMELAESYLYKDILELEGIRRASVLEKLLTALALQIGSEVSYNEISKTVGVDSKTVEKYIDLLEKCYVVFRLNSFSRNLRTELTKGKKIYFYDNGIRNAILKQFAPLDLRQDAGALWENFFISERIKQNHYDGRYVNSYFWRTTDKQEIDYVEEENGLMHLYELKWNPARSKAKLPKTFVECYNPATSTIVTPDNYLNILLENRL